MSTSPPRDELYVGYLPVPPRQKSFLRWVIPAMLVMICGFSFLWANSQHTPGSAVWDQDKPIKLRGIIVVRPYPMLLTTTNEGKPELVLVVEVGKHGGGRRAAAFGGKQVIVSGFPLHRDGRSMVELDTGPDALVQDAVQPAVDSVPVPRPVGRVTLRGEIIDSKCFLGAMKPGEGKTHKECATLCIRGGIPPMLVTRDSTGRPTYYLLQDHDGGPADAGIQPFIADPVELSGDLAEWAGLNLLSVRPTEIRRLRRRRWMSYRRPERNVFYPIRRSLLSLEARARPASTTGKPISVAASWLK